MSYDCKLLACENAAAKATAPTAVVAGTEDQRQWQQQRERGQRKERRQST